MAIPPKIEGRLEQPALQKPRWNGDELRAQLSLYDRRPFIDLLAEWLECGPSREDIEKFSAKYPDRYAGALRQLGQLGGYTEKRELNIDVNVNVRAMSDSQLQDRIRTLTQQLVIDGEVVIPDEQLKNGDLKSPQGIEDAQILENGSDTQPKAET